MESRLCSLRLQVQRLRPILSISMVLMLLLSFLLLNDPQASVSAIREASHQQPAVVARLVTEAVNFNRAPRQEEDVVTLPLPQETLQPKSLSSLRVTAAPMGTVTPVPTARETPVPVELSQDPRPSSDQKSSSNQNEERSGGCPDLSSNWPESIRKWGDLICPEASKVSIDPDLMAAVMLQESGGNPEAYSSSGAVGLLQVMPRDGIAANFYCVNGPCFANRPSMEELFDPAFNVSYGARMLAGLIQRHGSVREALRAYGPSDMGYAYADLVLGHLATYGE